MIGWIFLASCRSGALRCLLPVVRGDLCCKAYVIMRGHRDRPSQSRLIADVTPRRSLCCSCVLLLPGTRINHDWPSSVALRCPTRTAIQQANPFFGGVLMNFSLFGVVVLVVFSAILLLFPLPRMYNYNSINVRCKATLIYRLLLTNFIRTLGELWIYL